MNEIIYSVIMPTYNAGRTIDQSLKGIRQQDFNQDQIEILVVDGGSTDCTLEVAKKYGAIIIPNPDRLPEPAKLYGMQRARGHYICVMGSDEIMTNPKLFKDRYAFLQRNPDIHGMLSELVAPKGYEPCCTYMNAVGDPFTCFVYQTYGNRIYNLRKKLLRKDGNVFIYQFDQDDIIPIGDGGTVMDMDFIRSHFGDLIKTHETSVLWDIIIRTNGLLACMENDQVVHLSLCDWKTYYKKLKFRVINNIHNVQGSGYAFRAQTNKKLNRRKYLFPLYCITIFWPIIDGVKMSVRMKSWIFLVHPIFCWYVLVTILFQYGKKLLGLKSKNTIYGK